MKFSSKIIKKEIKILETKYLKYTYLKDNDVNDALDKVSELLNMAETQSAQDNIRNFAAALINEWDRQAEWRKEDGRI